MKKTQARNSRRPANRSDWWCPVTNNIASTRHAGRPSWASAEPDNQSILAVALALPSVRLGRLGDELKC